MVVSTIPYLIGFILQGAEWRFTGFVISVEDGNAFVGKMLAGNTGEWLFRTPYTAYAQKGFLIFPTYLLAGKLVNPPFLHEKLVITYHVYRFLAGCFAIIATYLFLSLFVKNVGLRFFGLSLAVLGGGIGWILFLFNRPIFFDTLPLSFYSPESFGFLSLLIYPHYCLARGLLLFSLGSFVRVVRDPYRINIFRRGFRLGFLWLLTGLAQPLTGMVFGAVCGIFTFSLTTWQFFLLIKNRETDFPRLWQIYKFLFAATIISGPFILYNLVGTIADPYIKAWTEQSTFNSPEPIYYILAYGITIPFGILGSYRLFKSKTWDSKLPGLWVLSFPILAYAPIGIQRRIPEGIWIAFVILAIKGIESLKNMPFNRSGYLLLLCFPSSMLLLIGSISASLSKEAPVYRPCGEVEAFLSLSGGDTRKYVVLASYESSNALPAWAPVYVLTGHGPESIYIDDITSEINEFFQSDTSDITRKEFIEKMGIDYIFWGPDERDIGDWNPKKSGFLTVHYENNDYAIFNVID